MSWLPFPWWPGCTRRMNPVSKYTKTSTLRPWEMLGSLTLCTTSKRTSRTAPVLARSGWRCDNRAWKASRGTLGSGRPGANVPATLTNAERTAL